MSSLNFGTSGLRGLVEDLVGAPSRDWTSAFLEHLAASGRPAKELLIGQDLRASSPEIAEACAQAAQALGVPVLDCGAVPTPALAFAALERGAPAVMVTGSHIPDDRNGLKFYRADGEIDKGDEAAIRGCFAAGAQTSPEDRDERGPCAQQLDIIAAYRQRYTGFFGEDALSGLRVGVYQHSSVARDILVDILSACGAQVVPFGRSDAFVPVDTEAHRSEDVAILADAAKAGRFDALVSTDGDADRPLVADEAGRILRGDVVGLLTARHLGIATIVTPVTSSSAIESMSFVTAVIRTRVGSPFVIDGIETATRDGHASVVGFEANGGVLLGSAVTGGDATLSPLATRDAVLPILATLGEIKRTGQTLARIVAALKAGHIAAHRLKDVDGEARGALLVQLADDAGFARDFFAPVGAIVGQDQIDGIRTRLQDGTVIHYRASGNAPELRCYVEADSSERAQDLLEWGLRAAGDALAQQGGKSNG